MKLGMFVNRSILYRAWYYFRLGYLTYFSFLLGYVSTLVTLYYLAIRNIPDLSKYFPHFGLFAFLGTIIGFPLAALVGWVHLKRSPVYAAEVEANPYNYKLPPGYWLDLFAPTLLELLRQNRKILAQNNLLSSEDEKVISKLEKDFMVLLSGGYIGLGKRKSK